MKLETRNSILFYFVSFQLSLLSAYLIWLQTSKYGIGLTPDSITYLRWAESIYKEGFSFVLGNKSAVFSPFYPIVLSIVLTLFNVDSLIAARWFNIFLIFILSFLSMILCRKLTKSPAVLLIFGLFIVFSKPTNLVFSFAFSEPLFIFILLLIIFAVEKTTYKRLILCGFLTSLAILTRYAGVSIVPAVCLYIFIQKSEISEKIKKCFCYATIPSLVYLLYIARNYYFTGTLMGARFSSKTGLISNFDRSFSTILFWFSGQYLFIVAFFIFIFGAFIWTYKQDLVSYILDRQKTIDFAICFSVVYSIFIIISSTTTAYDLINDRLMSPVFSSILLMVFFFILFGLRIVLTIKKGKMLAYTTLSIFTICTLLSFYTIWKNNIWSRTINGAGGYASVVWQENQVLNYLKTNELNSSEKIYTNDIFPFFFANKKIIPLKIPWKEQSNSKDGITLENFATKVPYFENSILVYFSNKLEPYAFTLSELQTICEMRTIIQTIDGSILRVGKCKKYSELLK